MNLKGLFVSGIDTDTGKTIVSSVLVEALGYDYWKPIQSGTKDGTDTQFVQSVVNRKDVNFHKEIYSFREPLSPHLAARLEGGVIKKETFDDVYFDDPCIVEGAGGLMVPLNEDGFLMIDLIEMLHLPVLMVIRDYLGSINHSLLSIEALQKRNIHIAGIVFNGSSFGDNRDTILKLSGEKEVLRIDRENQWTSECTKKYAAKLKDFVI